MRRILSLYLVLVVVGVLCYCLAVAGWTNSKAVGPHAFPGSPDWGYMYGSSLERYFWMSGMLFGLSLGAVALLASGRASESMAQGKWVRAMAIASVAIPAMALAVGHFYETSIVQGDAVVGEMRSNRSLNWTLHGAAPSGIISFLPCGTSPFRAG